MREPNAGMEHRKQRRTEKGGIDRRRRAIIRRQMKVPA
jgi:hypothetical protein